MSYKDLNAPISSLNGVGKTRELQLNKLGLYTLRDLVYFFPRSYEFRGDIKYLSDAPYESPTALLLTVATEVKSVKIKNKMTVSKFRAFDHTGSVEVVFFNSAFVKDVFHIGTTFRFWGRLSINKNVVQLSNPKYEPYIEGVPLPDMIPVYPLTEGISSKFIDKITKAAMSEVLPQIADPLPDDIRIKYGLSTLSFALKNIHFPQSRDDLHAALSRLAFDEMLLFGIGISFMSRYKSSSKGIKFSKCDLRPLLDLLPYELTSSQKQAINDVYSDTVLNAKSPMSRIIVGDVGSGKTICAIAAIYIAVKSGYQATMMAPTEILATQHYKEAVKLLEALGIRCELLLGVTTKKEKSRIYDDLRLGKIDVVIGTHSLISDKVEFNNLGLVITDEQHRFGVAQRAKLKDKSTAAHLLVMSATPIPRTLALTMYGDLDVSRITEMPKGRQRVDTFVVDDTYRERLLSFISKQIELGGQCYVVCPAIEETEVEDDGTLIPSSINELNSPRRNTKNVLEHTDFLRQKLPHLKIESLHGKMKSAEKEKVMGAFSSGDVHILVSTTVIEVGINVPNASLMIVEDADRFGLSQLHQLRGRVGRGTRRSYCVLVNNTKTEKATSRLEIMRTTYDGYEISEKDLLLRGPGEFFSDRGSNLRQSGGFEFKLAKLCDDHELFDKAFAAAKSIVERDPELNEQEHLLLKSEIQKIITPITSTIS